jgi:hypothetical protein
MKVKTQFRVIITCLLATFTLNAGAFKPELHARYALRGANALATCMNGRSMPDAWLMARLAEGTFDEDKTQLLQRVTNWHYAKTGRESWSLIFPWPLWGFKRLDEYLKMNLDQVFKIRVSELLRTADLRNCDKGQVFEKAGRILHFLQDMRVPAHVIPIHHGSLLGDDGFDGYIFDYEDGNFPFAASDCREIAQAAKSLLQNPKSEFNKRLKAARTHTERQLDTPFIGKCSAAETFWCDPARESCAGPPGYGNYRKDSDGNEVTFGKTRVFCKGAMLNATEQHYKTFFKDGYREMMKDTATVALYADLLAEGCSSDVAKTRP